MAAIMPHIIYIVAAICLTTVALCSIDLYINITILKYETSISKQ